jgi:signal transduction histidine kinase
MVQVLVNLLTNAIKFSTPRGSVSVSSHRDGKVVRIEVTDQGVGISEADQKIIFDPYKQAKQQKGQRKVEGTGLGLTICKSIVEAHNGTIGVVSAKPQGITFWIEIPVAD